MKDIITYKYSGPEDFSFWEWFWPSQDMKFHPMELRSSLEYYYRMKRGKDEVESEVGEVSKLKFLGIEPGHYYSDGIKFYRRD